MAGAAVAVRTEALGLDALLAQQPGNGRGPVMEGAVALAPGGDDGVAQ